MTSCWESPINLSPLVDKLPFCGSYQQGETSLTIAGIKCFSVFIFKHCCEKARPRDFRQGQTQTTSQGYKTFFMLNSAEHEILTAHKH